MTLFKLVILAVVGLACVKEYIRYRKTELACEFNRSSDRQLINSNLCTRTDLKPENRIICIKARDRLIVPLFFSAFEKWWADGEIMRIWNIMMSSYFTMLIAFVPLTIWALYRFLAEYFGLLRQTQFFEKQIEFQKSMYESDSESEEEEKKHLTWSRPD